MFFIIHNDQIRQNCFDYLKGLTNVTVEIKQHKKGRSTQQNKMYWSILGLIAKEGGYETDDLHLALKCRFLGTEEKVIMGKVVTVPKSTTKLNTREFGELIDKVYALASELNIKLPTPQYMGFE